MGRTYGEALGDSQTTMLEALRLQARGCERMGSGLYGRLMTVAADDFEAGGPTERLLSKWDGGNPVREAAALRLAGGVHRLVLAGEEPRLAEHYPSVGGEPRWPEAGIRFLDVIDRRHDWLLERLGEPVQTNEVNRSAVLLGGLLTVAAQFNRPLRVLEIGAAAGLNLLFDRYRYDLTVGTWGKSSSPVTLRSEWSGPHPTVTTGIEVAERAGSDIAPIDVTTDEEARRLLSFVWPDQAERIDRWRQAIRVARASPPSLEEADADEWLAGRLAARVEATATVVMHSIMWQYVPADQRERILDVLNAAGRQATSNAPFAWLRFEPGPTKFEVRLTTWPGAQDRILGVAHAHGTWVKWGDPQSEDTPEF